MAPTVPNLSRRQPLRDAASGAIAQFWSLPGGPRGRMFQPSSTLLNPVPRTLMNLRAFSSGCILLLLLLLNPAPATASETDDRLLAISKELPFISVGEFLVNREPRDYSGADKVTDAWKILQRLNAPDFAIGELVKSSEHADPNVRALALLALVARERQEFVGVAIRLINDPAPTKPEQYEPGGRIGGERFVITRPLTVAGVARRSLYMVGFPGVRYDDDGTSLRTEPPDWWKNRKDNPEWLGWYAFLGQRVRRGVTGWGYATQPDIKRYQDRLNALPPVARAWALLFLSDEIYFMDGKWHDHYASEAEMLTAAKALRAEVLMEFLKSGDRQGLKHPRLDEGNAGKRFLIEHARELFDVRHAKALLELKLHTAAADADPRLVREAVAAAMATHTPSVHNSERGKAMATLAALGDAADRARVVKWFYEESNADTGSTPHYAFLLELERRRPGAWRDIVRQLIAHPGFDQLKPLNVSYLAIAIGKLGGENAIADGRYYRGTEEFVRKRLREMFQVPSVAEPELATPKELADKPEWSVELGAFGHSLAISPDGRHLAVGMDRQEPLIIEIRPQRLTGMRVLDATNGQERFSTNLPGMLAEVFFVGTNAQLVGTAMHGKQLALWSGKDGATASLQLPTFGFFWPARTGLRAVSFDTTGFAWLEFPSLTKLWTQPRRMRFPPHVAIAPDAAWIAVHDGWEPKIDILETGKGERRGTLIGHAANPRRIVASPDSQMVASVGDDNRLFVWSVATQKVILRLLGKREPPLRGGVITYSRATPFPDDPVTMWGPLAFAADSKSFFACPENGVLGCYSVADGKPQFGMKLAGYRIEDAVASADRQFVFVMVRKALPSPSGERFDYQTKWTSRVECWRVPRLTRLGGSGFPA